MSILLLPLSYLFITSSTPPSVYLKMLRSRKARFLLLSSFQRYLKPYMLQEAFQLNQQQFYICLCNSLYATGVFCLNHTGLEIPDHHLPEAGLCFTSLVPSGGKQSSATPRTKVLLQNGIGSSYQVHPAKRKQSTSHLS